MYSLTVGELIELLNRAPNKNSHIVFVDQDKSTYNTETESKLNGYQGSLFWVDIYHSGYCDGC